MILYRAAVALSSLCCVAHLYCLALLIKVKNKSLFLNGFYIVAFCTEVQACDASKAQ